MAENKYLIVVYCGYFTPIFVELRAPTYNW